MPRPADEWIRTKSHPEIIEEATMEEVRRILNSRAPRQDTGSPHSTFAFTGLLRCSRCGQGFQSENATGRSKTYWYYNCRSAQKGTGCTHRRLPARDLDAWLIESILDRVLNPTVMREIAEEISTVKGRWAKERDERVTTLRKEQRAVDGRRSKLFDVLELHGRDAPNLADLTERLRALNAQAKDLERELTRVLTEAPPTTEIDPVEIDTLAELMRETVRSAAADGRVKRVREFFASFIDAIVVDDDEVDIRYQPERLLAIPGASTLAVRSKARWLPDLGSNQGPAD
ncbi:MAG: zinc ribbon domain-containing protein [Burkholderiales bacterium]|nr:zinc ribbon domain-containing protein [Burkholderiales bacterium]